MSAQKSLSNLIKLVNMNNINDAPFKKREKDEKKSLSPEFC